MRIHLSLLEIDKKLKGEKDQMSVAADHVKMTNRMRNKSGGDKGRHGVSSVDVLLLKNQSLVSSDVGNVCEAEAEDLGALAHEAQLEKLCWIPFSIQTLTVGEEGGLFPLQPQTTEGYKDNDVITLEVPEGAVNTAVCDRLCIRYGVIVFGPFDLPEGYQLGSMAVYIYFNQDHAVKPVILHLSHWSGKDGETGLKCVVAPHRLEEGEKKYKFKDVEEGNFQSREGRALISIDGHSSLFADVFRGRFSSNYLATSLIQKSEKDLKAFTRVAVTYSSSVWIEILKDYRKGFTEDTIKQTFSFEKDTGVSLKLVEAKGPGWEAVVSGYLLPENVRFEMYEIRSPEQLEQAVVNELYPPCLTCKATSSREAKESGKHKDVKVILEGTKHPTECMVFTCPAYEERSTERDAPIGMNSLQHQVLSAPTHMTGSPTSDAQGVPSGVGILGVVETITNWEMLALRLGIPLTHVDECKNDRTLGKSKTFDYWRNGRCDRKFPITWAFLLECVEKTCGTRVAGELKKRTSEYPTWTEK